MIRYKDLHIPDPCSVNYNSLPYAYDEGKRFCGSCKKDVYDFRGKDEEFLNATFKDQGKVCGIFYEDQLSNKKSKPKKSLYNYLFLKIISIVLFIKSFLLSHESKASEIFSAKVSQTSIDSTGIKTVFKRQSRTRYEMSMYVNDVLYKEYVHPKNGFIYLPDTIKPDDRIKVKIFPNKRIKSKIYNFKYSEAETITIKITSKRTLQLFRRRHIGGCPSNFW